jgi:hypothetical protein
MFIVPLVTCILVLLVVGVHYNALLILTAFLQRRTVHMRRWVAISILGLLLAHSFEVSIFSFGYWLLEDPDYYGELIGYEKEDGTAEFNEYDQGSFRDYWYYSFVAYTSLGFGDIVPTKWLRIMTAFETLTGLILIAWSASFLFMQMQRLWDEDPSQL